jgi:hypothetical protein
MELNYNRANELLARNANYEKVICVASSGIASLLLSGGTTAHSRFKIPLVCDGSSTCNVTPTDQVGQQASLIIWDEVPMQGQTSVRGCSPNALRCPWKR